MFVGQSQRLGLPRAKSKSRTPRESSRNMWNNNCYYTRPRNAPRDCVGSGNCASGGEEALLFSAERKKILELQTPFNYVWKCRKMTWNIKQSDRDFRADKKRKREALAAR